MLQTQTIEFIIPVYNEEKCLDELVNRILKLREKMNTVNVGAIFINDGSTDRSLELLSAYADKYNFFKIISFSRNFGHQLAITAGIDHCAADYAIVIDADLQDPPELVEEMYKKTQEGFDVIYGQRQSRKGETFFKRITARLFYKLIGKMCDVDIPVDTGDFRMMSSKVIKILQGMKEKHRFIRGMVPWIGFKSAPVLYIREQRFAGETKYPLSKMIRFAKDAIFSFSNTPLKIASFIGYSIVGVGVLGSIFVLYLKLMTSLTVPGITAVILSIIILGGIQIIMLGMLGEYVGRIFEESKNRPLYIVSDTKNFKKENDSVVCKMENQTITLS